MNIHFIDSNDWKHVRDEELANFFYGCLTFGGDQLAQDCLNKWNARYGEINSLFYCKENISHFPTLQNATEPVKEQIITPIYNLLKHKNVPWGKMLPQFFKDLEVENFVMLSDLAYDIMMYSIKEANKDLMDYLIPKLDFQNTRRLKHISRMMTNKVNNRELLQYFMHQPDLQPYKENIFATALLWGGTYNNTSVIDYLHSLKNGYLEIFSKKAHSLIIDNPNIVTIRTKDGDLGSKEEVLARLQYYKLAYVVPNKEGIKQKAKI